MRYNCQVIHGHGRGKGLGFPTLNLTIPTNFPSEEGVYAAWVVIDSVQYRGALHFGPIPTFQEKERSLEVYVLDYQEIVRPTEVEIELVKRIRSVVNFATSEALQEQISKDVEETYSSLV